ncbi:MAG TPA: hypothetical protein DHW87_02765, partial [Fervidobacterium sp.]|nr:hypothetical protein [Fervidobacterium sp.]
MGIFRNRIMAYNISNFGAKNNQYVEVLSGLFSRNKIRIKNYFPQIIQPDPEDLVVVNVPWDIIRMAFVELPPIKKEEEKLKLAELE